MIPWKKPASNSLSLLIESSLSVMKTIRLEIPDQIARIFEGMADKRKASAALLAAFIVQATPQTLESIIEQSDRKVALSGLTPEEIEKLLNELS